jgi:hypothetical protein
MRIELVYMSGIGVVFRLNYFRNGRFDWDG